MASTVQRTFKLLSGHTIPTLGLGSYQAYGEETIEAISEALKIGYRHIDTAEFYENEKEVGEAVRASGIPRDELFITTKLWIDGHGAKSAEKHFKASLRRLGLDYVDLYLIHSPGGGKLVETYSTLLQMQQQGLTRSVGVSNFGVQHIEGLRQAGLPLPSVNQIELHPFLQQREIVEYCRAHGVVVEAYSPLTKGKWMKDPRLVEIAKKEKRSVAQILIRWSLEKRFVCLPKSSNPARIAENYDVFDWSLSEDAIRALDDLEADRHCTWDPTREPWNG